MGIGRLNPGCDDCGCVPVIAPSNVCQEIGLAISPQSFRLDWRTWGFGNGILSDGCRTEFGNPARFDENDPSIEYFFPPYHDPTFECNIGLALIANTFDASGYPYPNGARFPVYQDTNCKYGLTNYYLGDFSSTNSCIAANASVSFSRDISGNVWMAVVVSIGAIVFATNKFGTTCFASHPTTGNNWNYSESGSRITWTETGGPSYRQSFFERTILDATEFESWPFCSNEIGVAQSDFERWSIQSTNSIRLNDPIFGDLRTFNIWIPDPMPTYGDEFLQGASVSVSLGID